MDITRRKTLNEMIDESEDLKLRWQQLDGLPVGSSEHAQILDGTASVLAGWVPQGRFMSPGTPERRALRSMLDYWVGRLGDQGRGEEGIETIESFDPEAGVVLDVDRCPYPGLLPYDANDRACFFGREALVEQVRDHLDLPGSRIFLIVGSSGSGKSSLALAGVIPKLAERYAGEWLFAPRMTPGIHPMANLAASVAAAIGKPEESMALEKALVAAPAEARELVGRACESKPLLLLVDQLEELLTLCLDGKERAAFAAVLVSLSDSKPSGDGFACRTLLTLRADYKTRLESSEARPLYVRLVDERNSVDMTSIGFADIRRAIQQPADAVGLRFVPSALIDSLASQTAGLANGLPLLQFALQLLWATRPGYEKGQPKDLVTEAMVKALPDVQRALGQVADGLYEGFNAVQKRLCERLMQELIVLDDTYEEPLRRRRDEAELVKVLHTHYPDPADTDCVLEAFVKAHLIQRFGVKPATQIEVAHEALLRHWERIHKLLNSDAVKGRLHLIKEVGKAAEQWDKNGRRNGYLTLPAERLALAVEHDSDGWFADPLPKDFIAACHRRQIEAQQQAQQVELAKEQAKAAVLASQRLRTKVWGFGSGLAALLTLVVAWGYTASDLQRKGKSDALASRAILLNDQDPALSVHIALTALREDASNAK